MANKEREEFVNWLDGQVQRAGGLRAAGSKAGVSHATLLRGLQGEPLSLTTLEGISKWTGVSLTRLLRLYGEERSGPHPGPASRTARNPGGGHRRAGR
jgi:hypothetical protein